MPDGKPNILVIWGDDIGDHQPQLLQRRADGLSHAQHRPHRQRGDALHRLLRRAELHGRPVVVHHRPERVPHRPDQGRRARAPTSASRRRTRRSPSCSSRSATPPASSARTTSATGTSTCPPSHGFDEFFGNLYHLNAEEEPEHAELAATRTSRGSTRCSVRAACMHSWATDEDDDTVDGRYGRVGKQRIEDTGPLTKKRMETDRRRDRRRGNGLHRAAARGRHAVLRVDEHHPHALPHPHQAGEHRPGRPVAVAPTTTR